MIQLLQASRYYELTKQFNHEELGNLLTERDLSGNHIGNDIAINHDAQTLNNYITFTLEHVPELTPAIFTSTNMEDRHIGHHIAKYQTTETLARFLSTVHTKIPMIFENLALATPKNGWTMGHFIAQFHSEELLVNYLSTLSCNPKTLEKILLVKNKDGWTIAHIIARRHNTPEALINFLPILFSCSPITLGKIVSMRIDTWTIAHIIARHQTTAALIDFLSLILTSRPQNFVQTITEINKKGFHVGHFLSERKSTSQQDLIYFFRLIKSHAPTELAGVIHCKCADGTTMVDSILKNQANPGMVIYELLISNISFTPEMQTKLISKKASVFEHIRTFSAEEQISVIEGIKNHDSQLSVFFATKRGWNGTGVTQDLDKLLSEAKSKQSIASMKTQNVGIATWHYHTYKPPMIVSEEPVYQSLQPVYMPTPLVTHSVFQPLRQNLSTVEFQSLINLCPAVPIRNATLNDLKKEDPRQWVMRNV